MSTWHGSLSRFLLPMAAAAILAGSALVAPPVAGQEPDTPDRNCVCFDDPGEVPALRAFTLSRRARLGVVLGEPTEVAGRTGVRLDDVRDGSPAGRAGLRDGDVLVALNGRELGTDPTSTLLDLMEEVEPGDTVATTFFRGDDERTARVVTDAGSMFGGFGDGARFHIRGPGARGTAILPPAPGRAPRFEARRPGLLYRNLLRGGLELAAVNPDLGTYFGTDRGVLVTDIDEDSPLDLRAGDVILAIAGRDVRDPAHVRAILASYRADEEIAFRVVREKRTIEVIGRGS